MGEPTVGRARKLLLFMAFFLLIDFIVITFNDEIFPFSRFSMFQSTTFPVCNFRVLDDQGQAAKLKGGYGYRFGALGTNIRQRYSDPKICFEVAGAYKIKTPDFKVQILCASDDSDESTGIYTSLKKELSCSH